MSAIVESQSIYVHRVLRRIAHVVACVDVSDAAKYPNGPSSNGQPNSQVPSFDPISSALPCANSQKKDVTTCSAATALKQNSDVVAGMMGPGAAAPPFSEVSARALGGSQPARRIAQVEAILITKRGFLMARSLLDTLLLDKFGEDPSGAT